MKKLLIVPFILSCFFATAQVFPLGNTIDNPGWYKIGTLSLGQNGQDAVIKIVGGLGYNASVGQNGNAVIHFRTSNAYSNANNFYAAGYFYNEGGSKVVRNVIVKQVDLSTWDFFVQLPQFTGDGSFVHVLSNNGMWTPAFQLLTTAPTGTALSEQYLLGTTLDVNGKVNTLNSLETNDYAGVGQHNGQIRILNGKGVYSSRAMEFALLDNGTGVIQANESNVGYNSLALNPVAGYVGINTIHPTQALSVNGTVLARKVRVSQSASDWPDYVFDSSYQLPTLDSVSSFIQANKHLPDMPSAAVIEKDGHDLGEVQKQLLKKVEELTLYIIEQNKRIEMLENKISSQYK